MSVTFEQAPEAEVGKVVAEVMAKHHGRLAEVGITVECLFARKYNKEDEPVEAMMVRGHPALAKISITNLQDRVRGLADAKLVIDAEFGWKRLTPARREALIDHELTHLDLVVDADGVQKVDDHGRPKLKIRHHTWELTGFAEVAERHGEAAIEVREMTRWAEEYGQFALFPLAGTKEVKVRATASA